MGYTYHAYHPIGRQLLASSLRFIDPQWIERPNGIGEFSGTMVIPSMAARREQLFAATAPDESAIYVMGDNGTIPFGGVVVGRKIDEHTQQVSITAVSWRYWLYTIFLGPKLDLTGDNLYGWTNQDQLLIARQIVGYAIAAGVADGRPLITIGSEVSGKLRDLNVKGLDFKYAGELLDTMSQRSGGFEWDLVPYIDTDGLPRLRFMIGYPEIGSFQTGFVLKRTRGGANFTVNGQIQESSTSRRTRVWTTGASTPDTLPFAVDSDPTIGVNATLLSERVTSYSSVLDRATLSSHARAERRFLNERLSFLDVTVQQTVVDPDTYAAGDRVRLIYRTNWYDLDLPAVRIVERTVTPTSDAGVAKLKLDLSDAMMPDVDSGVTTA